MITHRKLWYFVKTTSQSVGCRIRILSLVVLTCLLASGAAATPRLQLGAVRGFGGSTVQLPLSLRYATNDARNVVGLQADLLFDSALAIGSPPVGGQVLADHLLDGHTLEGGWQRVLIYSDAYTPFTNGELATFSFSIFVGVLQNVRLTLSNVFLTTATGEMVPVAVASGGIVINAVFLQPSGAADGYLLVNTNNAIDQCFVVQATEDLQTWVNIETNTAAGSFLLFSDQDADDYPYRFYRAIQCEPAGAPKQ